MQRCRRAAKVPPWPYREEVQEEDITRRRVEGNYEGDRDEEGEEGEKGGVVQEHEK